MQSLLDRCLSQGAIGLKLLGGHYPLTSEATARAIELVNRNKAYIAFHCGTASKGSNIDGFLEAVELANGHALHIAHINSYTRGLKRPYMAEAEEAITALVNNPAIRSESYLSPMNGTSAKCSQGVPESLQTQTNLAMGGFAKTEAGFEEAIRAGWANINMEEGGRMVLATGERAVAYWRELGTDATVSFKVNPPEPRIRLAVAKRPDGRFVVDCISTDGGGIPRNVIVQMGLALVKLQALTLKEFVQKTSYNPARILGLTQKGHFRPGADADITVLNLDNQQPVMSLVNGKVIMHKGYVCGKGAQAITTPAGAAFVKEKGYRRSLSTWPKAASINRSESILKGGFVHDLRRRVNCLHHNLPACQTVRNKDGSVRFGSVNGFPGAETAGRIRCFRQDNGDKRIDPGHLFGHGFCPGHESDRM